MNIISIASTGAPAAEAIMDLNVYIQDGVASDTERGKEIEPSTNDGTVTHQVSDPVAVIDVV